MCVFFVSLSLSVVCVSSFVQLAYPKSMNNQPAQLQAITILLNSVFIIVAVQDQAELGGAFSRLKRAGAEIHSFSLEIPSVYASTTFADCHGPEPRPSRC
uniref:Putative secreted protein n=1 Tax=Ixodes ricinus TaxID=34613 RepID=A0A6B0UEN8_IXORI